MRSKLLSLILLAIIVIGCKNEPKPKYTSKPEAQLRFKKLDSIMVGLVKNGHSAGVAYGIQSGNEPAHIEAFGWADVDKSIKMKASTKFGLASVTKPFTAIAIAKLIEEGDLALDDPLTRFFPDFPEGSKVSIYQLLSHTSGINEWWVGGLPEGTPEDWTTSEHPHRYLQQMNTIYLFEPGTEYAYSNMGYLLLGEIIEQVSGKAYAKYVQESIFDALGMTNTSLVGGKETFQNTARGYSLSKEKDSSSNKTFVASSFIAGSLKSFGGLKSNVEDVLFWSNALFNENLVGKDILDQMTSYAKVNNGEEVYKAKYVHPDFPPPPPWEYMKRDGYGLGFSLTEIFGKKAIWHSGGMPGYNTFWCYFPESGTTLVILSNTDNGIMPAFEEIMKLVTE